jgi:two-component system OmpR family response regulator
LAKNFRRRTILVIDGDPAVRATVSEALGVEGYVVKAASPGAGSLSLIDEANLALLVMDPELPKSGHWTVPAAVKAHAAGVPILATGASYAVRRWAEELLAEGYIDKPFLLADLILAVTRICG